jgi:hypothetical protein
VARAGDAVSEMAYFAAHDDKPAQGLSGGSAGGECLCSDPGVSIWLPVQDEPELSYTELEFATRRDCLGWCFARRGCRSPMGLFVDIHHGVRQLDTTAVMC